MATVGVFFDGDLVEQLGRLDAGIKEHVLRSAAHAGAVVFYNEARLLAPIYTPQGGRLNVEAKPGQLRDSIYRVFSNDLSSDTQKVYEISWNHSKAPHGYWMENGYWLTRGPRKGKQVRLKWVPGVGFIRRAGDRAAVALAAADARAIERLKEVLASQVKGDSSSSEGTAT